MQYIYLANAHRKLFELSDGIRTLMSGSHLSLEILLLYFTAMHKNCAPPPANSRKNHGKIGRAHVELQSLMRISYAVFCLKKKNKNKKQTNTHTNKKRNNQLHTHQQ